MMHRKLIQLFPTQLASTAGGYIIKFRLAIRKLVLHLVDGFNSVIIDKVDENGSVNYIIQAVAS